MHIEGKGREKLRLVRGGYEKAEGILGAWRMEEEVWRVGDQIPACSWALQGSLTQNSCMNFLVDTALQFQIQHLFLFFLLSLNLEDRLPKGTIVLTLQMGAWSLWTVI